MIEDIPRHLTVGVILKWRRDPVQFVRDMFKVEPDEWQKDGLRFIANNPRLAMKACKGPGKTCELSWIGWWYLMCFTHPKVIATSITKANLEDGLWTEMSIWYKDCATLKSLFRVRKKSITYRKYPDTWFMVPRQFAKTATQDEQANTLAGKHAPNMLFLIDECGDIPLSLLASAEAALATVGDQKIAVAGNPTSQKGMLYHIWANEQHLWKVIEITSAPDDPKRSTRVTLEYAQGEIDRWGWDHPWVLVNIRGMFPPEDYNTLFGAEMVNTAMKRQIPDAAFRFSEKRLGQDVALYGDDSSVLFPRQGLAAFKPIIMRNAAPHEIGNKIMMCQMKWQEHPDELIKTFVDDTGGFGSGVTDWCNINGLPGIHGINFSSKADEPIFVNKRSEMFWRAADWTKNGGCLPDIPGLRQELCEHYYFFHKGKMGIEPKEDVRKRLGHSPDLADGFILTFAQIDMPARLVADHLGLHPVGKYAIPRHSGKMRSHYNPFDKNKRRR